MDFKHNTESQTVNWSVAVLCATLLLVYLILYFVKWDLRKQTLCECEVQSTGAVSLSELDEYTWDQIFMDDTGTYFIDSTYTWDYDLSSISDLSTDTWDVNSWMYELGGQDSVVTWWMVVLSWTKTYYGTLDFVEKLWISYKYALVDWSWIYYVNMWNYSYDFSDIVRKLGWNLYIMNTEQEILQNEMFGDKVTYINVPEYKNTKVLILLDINDQSWLLAIDYSIYHQVKSYLKSLFITTN